MTLHSTYGNMPEAEKAGRRALPTSAVAPSGHLPWQTAVYPQLVALRQ